MQEGDIINEHQFFNPDLKALNIEKALKEWEDGVKKRGIMFDDGYRSGYNPETGNFIHPTAIIYSNVTLGKNVYIGAYSVIGGPPEHRDYWDKEYKGVIIGDNVRISNHVTIDAGTEFDTIIEDNVTILRAAHVGHDSLIANGVTLSCNVLIGGHAQILHESNIGLSAVVHQRVIVPHNCMIGACAFIGKTLEMIPNSKYVGVPARYLGPNIKK